MPNWNLTWTAIVVVGLTACASRSVPASYPDTAAASPRAAAGVNVPVTVALEEDPPLPGEPTGRWRGLEATTATTAPSHPHHHHHGGGHAH